MTTRATTLTALAAAGLLSLSSAPAMSAAPPDPAYDARPVVTAATSERGNPVCRPGAKTVEKGPLRTKRGKRLGTAKITMETVDGTRAVCGIVKVRKPVRKRGTLVTLNLREFSPDGQDLGQAKAIQRATRLSPPSMTSNFDITGHRFTFRTKIDADARGKAKRVLRYTVG